MKLGETLTLYSDRHSKDCLCAKCVSARKSGLRATAAGGQSEGSSLLGRKWRVVSTRYGMSPGKLVPTENYADAKVIAEYPTREEAEKHSAGMPYTKVIMSPLPNESQQVRDRIRDRMVKTNPDVE